MNIQDFELSPEQIKACKSINRALTKARKLGLTLLAKQYELYAYRKESFNNDIYCPLHKTWNQGELIPHESCGKIGDSGADDMEYFKKDVTFSDL